MPRFRECHAEIRFDDGSPTERDDDAEVRIEGGQILLYYWDASGAVVFEGVRAPGGDFELRARSRPRVARLAQRSEGGILEGRWREGDAGGGLRIELGREEPE